MTSKSSSISKRTLWFAPKTTTSHHAKTVMLVQKPTHTITTFDVQDDEEVVIVAANNEVDLTDDEFRNHFQDTSSSHKFGNVWLKASLQFAGGAFFIARTCQCYAYSNMWSSKCKFPCKSLRINVVALYDTGANIGSMTYACYMKLKGPPSLKKIPVMSVQSAMGDDLYPTGLTCDATMGKSQFRFTFNVHRKL